ncbi:hypothetical protein VCR3J2_80664 [Vibrio coralliirubri]|nr:hypothetical protein VCR3J2_80664 [Vibrio coralliirubri]
MMLGRLSAKPETRSSERQLEENKPVNKKSWIHDEMNPALSLCIFLSHATA